ncbi:hypothetical protein [uncultured Arsenicicoccus sp.]|uniref:hypothetical protein n=1 Tax=uncultured Arsenicicoccus sp. TaxID=491339 RepID=UPI0025922E93|nr:hypothetical protein [uncultured Arsenicicoccus sp.]
MPDYYNATDQPVVIDDEGRVLPGREHADLDARTPEVKAAADRGDLVKMGEDTPTSDAKAAADAKPARKPTSDKE